MEENVTTVNQWKAREEHLARVNNGEVTIFGKSRIKVGETIQFNAKFLTATPNIRYRDLESPREGQDPFKFTISEVKMEITDKEGSSYRANVTVNEDLNSLIELNEISTETTYGVVGTGKKSQSGQTTYDRYDFSLQPTNAE